MRKELTVTRLFDAPVASVWQMWTKEEFVMRWWGPDKFTCPSAKIDFREGGTSIVAMRYPQEMGGNDVYNIWQYKKIVPLQSIEFIQNLADKNGKILQPQAIGMPPDFPVDVRVLVTFATSQHHKTEMTVTQFADFGQMSQFAKMGLEQSLDKMVKFN